MNQALPRRWRAVDPSLVDRLCALVLGVTASLLAGCENPCVAVCTDQTECEGADVSVNCETQCETAKENAEAIDCLSQYEDAIDCQSGVDDVCAIGDECVEQLETFQQCFAEGCAEDPDNAACQT